MKKGDLKERSPIGRNRKGELTRKLTFSRRNFERWGSRREIQKGRVNSLRGRVTFCRWVEIWIAHSKMSEWDEKEKEERPKRKRRENAKPIEVELEWGVEYSRGNMSAPSLENGKETHLVVFGQF